MQLRPRTRLKCSAIKQRKDDEIFSLSGKPYFAVVLAKSYVRPNYNMFIPTKYNTMVPSTYVAVTISCRGRNWALNCHGERKRKAFDSGWRSFCNDNHLRAGDACVFEVMECSSKKLKFHVQILRGDIPVELGDKVRGNDLDNPILID